RQAIVARHVANRCGTQDPRSRGGGILGPERLSPERYKRATEYRRRSAKFEPSSPGCLATEHRSARPTGGTGNGALNGTLLDAQAKAGADLRQPIPSGNPFLLSISHIVDEKLDNLILGRAADLR